MTDPAHKYSDEQIAAFQREVASVYKRYMADAKARLSDYLAKHEALDEQKRQLVEDGLLGKQDYASWRRMTVAVGKQYNAAVNEAAQCYTKANQIAVAALNDRLPAVYAENMNYQTYKVESGIGINTAFTLQDADTVQNMLKDSSAYVALPQRKVQVAKDVAWNKRQIGAYIQQGIFMGESIPKIAKRVSQEVGASNMKAATRIARTSVTAAESAGRLSALERAKALGIDCKIEWLATLDGRTRHSHRMVDGEQVEVGEKFSNGCRYPGDPDAPYAETANCRCTVVAGFEDTNNAWKDEASKRLMGQSYDDWKVSSAEAEIARLERSKARLNKSGGFYDPISGEFYSVSQHRKSAARIAEIKSDLKDSISSPAPWDSEDDIAEYKAYLKALKKYEGDAIKYADASARQEKLKQTIASIRDKVDERKA